jgi:parallel beta-helix repeat protein
VKPVAAALAAAPHAAAVLSGTPRVRPVPVLAAVSALLAVAAAARGATYYVSSASGNDADDGLTPATAFATVARVNALPLQPGDVVRFFCGETWRVDPLIVTRSGAAGTPAIQIYYSSHPAGCADKPLLSGARPIRGWAAHAANVWRADLGAGANQGLFPQGVNQLFRGATRLPYGRWPNREGHPDGGWESIDAQPAGDRITDAALPDRDWTGAGIHVKGIRWYVMNRNVTADSADTLTVNDPLSCWGGCTGWGYYLDRHLATLDREGEWTWEASTNRVYLYSTQGAPADAEIEGSVIFSGDGSYLGAVTLGRHLQEEVSWVVVENLRLERWFDNGVTTPVNLEADENSWITLQDLAIRDVDDAGIRLTTWVWDAAAHGNGPNGWRGGNHIVVRRNLIERANSFGIDSFARLSTFEDNTIRDVARIEYLGREGMGCGFTGTNCTEHGAGVRLNRGGESPNHSGYGNTLRHNRLERIGMNGVDVFGRQNVLEENVIVNACRTKGDCGGVRTFGNDSLAASWVSDVVLRRNVITDTYGNTDGCRSDFDTLFGFGIYVDNYSRNVTVEQNTVARSTIVGILFQNSTGSATDNVVYDNAEPASWGTNLNLVGGPTDVALDGNVLFSLAPQQRTLAVENAGQLAGSDFNVFFSPHQAASIAHGGTARTLASWQSTTGLDGSSSAQWYTDPFPSLPRSQLFVNATGSQVSIPLTGSIRTLANQPFTGPLVLAPYTSRVLVRDRVFADGFDSGDTSRWSSASP